MLTDEDLDLFHTEMNLILGNRSPWKKAILHRLVEGYRTNRNIAIAMKASDAAKEFYETMATKLSNESLRRMPDAPQKP